MARAAILVVDVQPEDLARLGQELRKRYRHDYEILARRRNVPSPWCWRSTG